MMFCDLGDFITCLLLDREKGRTNFGDADGCCMSHVRAWEFCSVWENFGHKRRMSRHVLLARVLMIIHGGFLGLKSSD